MKRTTTPANSANNVTTIEIAVVTLPLARNEIDWEIMKNPELRDIVLDDLDRS